MWALFSASDRAAYSATCCAIEALSFALYDDTFFPWVLVLLLVTAGSFSALCCAIEASSFATYGDTFFPWVLVLLLVAAGSFSLLDFASQVRKVARESLRLFVLAQSLAA